MSEGRTANPHAKYFGCPDIIKFPLGGDVLAYSGMTKSTLILTKLQAGLLSTCVAPKTLDEHARGCQEQLPHASIETIREQLAVLVEQGCLLSESDLRRRCERVANGGQTAGKIDQVGVVTCDRPERLSQCLSSYVLNARSHDRSSRYIVADDTRDARTRDDIRDMLKALGKRHGVQITYLGLEEKRGLADRLALAGDIPKDVIDFGLFDVDGCGVSIGANRNALLLSTVGHLAWSTDDDILCRVARNPAAEDALTIGNVERFNDYGFFSDRSSALSSVEVVDADLLGLHEEVLGVGLADYISRRAGDSAFGFAELDPYLFRGLISGGAKVRLTYVGTVGDSATRSPLMFLEAGGASRPKFLESEEQYRLARDSREVLRSVSRLVITKNSRCMTGAYAFDNREILPPFFPLHRNEDGIYGHTLKATLADACYAHLPYVLLHDPPESRAYAGDELLGAASYLHVSHIVIACVQSFVPPHRRPRPDDNLRKLGEHLSAIASLPPPDFEEFVRVQLLRLRASQATALENLLRRVGGSASPLTDDVGRYLDKLRRTLLTRESIYPQNIAGAGSLDEALGQTARLVFQFGQYLGWWPSIVKAAGGVNASAAL